MSSILWRCLRWPGHEVAHVMRRGDDWRLEGVAAFAQNREPTQLRYAVDCDSAWMTRRAMVEGWVGSRRVDLTIEVRDGEWWIDGTRHEGVRGCVDIDLNFSPSTNLLPIRRLDLQVGDSASVRAAWLRFPGLNLEPLAQAYARLDESTYEYRSGSFEAKLAVRPDGLVRDYAGVWIDEPLG